MSQRKAGPASTDRSESLLAVSAEAEQAEAALGLAWGSAVAQAGQFQADWLRDTAEAAARFRACLTPGDWAAATQGWVTARACAYANAGMRMASIALVPAEAAATRAGAFRLPD